VVIRETFGNGFVYQLVVLDTSDSLHTVWSGVDPSLPGSPANFTIDFAQTDYLVKGIKVYVDTDHDMGAWEEIDSIQLSGLAAAGATVTEQGTPAGDLIASGNIAFADVDLTDTHSIDPTITASPGALGILTASVTTDTTGTGAGGVTTWNYSVADAAVEYLGAGQSKLESFTITLQDNHGGVDTQQIDVTISGTNDAPVAVADTLTATEDTPVTYTTAQLLGNDTDVDNTNGQLVIASVTSGTGGTVVLNGDGTVTFTPSLHFNGAASFGYTTTDGTDSSNTATVTVNVSVGVGETWAGTTGNDTHTGTAYDDTLLGLAGNDTLNGGTGADWLQGDAGTDTLILTPDSVWSSAHVGFNEGSPTISGTGQKVSLAGKNRFSDVLDGGSDADTLQLTNGNDAYFLHDAFSGFTAGITLATDVRGQASAVRGLSIEQILAGGGDDLVDLTSANYSIAGVTVDGGSGNDMLWGNAGNDTLLGGDGNDTLFGGVGNDFLSGGAGADVFQFVHSGGGSDQISDFDTAQDKLRLYGATSLSELTSEVIGSDRVLNWNGQSITLLGLTDTPSAGWFVLG
jgi:VCBS repeat-containing protein